MLIRLTRFCGIVELISLFLTQKTSMGLLTDQKSPFKARLSLVATLVVLMSVMAVEANPVFKVYPLADEYFQKIYMVQQEQKIYYLTVSCRQQNILSISFTQQKQFHEHPRFNIYGNLQLKPKVGMGAYTFLRDCDVEVEVDKENLIQIKRTKDSSPFFSITNVTFDHLHNSARVIDHSTKWGLGERFQNSFKVKDGKWTLWNRDKPWKVDRGLPGVSDQTYGYQPVYLARCKQTKLHHFVYFKNTFGLLVEATKDANQLFYNSIGGPMQFIVLIGGQDPEQLLQRYHDYIGPSLIPPFWSMGYHQCRWGYKMAKNLIQVLTKFREHDIPIDTIWSDLDYMESKKIFTVNEYTHGHGQLNKMMKDFDAHFVPLLDVGISIHDKPAVNLGTKLDVFLRHPKKMHQYYVAEVWPGPVHFTDYLHPNAIQFWKEQLRRLYQQVQFSGLWIDMNQPSNFRGNQPTIEPFRLQKGEGVNMMTINIEIPHYSDSEVKLQHREVHTYYGHLSTLPLNQFLWENGKRPFIISRSNSVGSGQFAGHWTGDNVANWQFLRLSINGNFLFQIFGIQMVGADICGFNQNTNQELCSRWYQVGSFYPFSRNHNVDTGISQEPYSFGKTLLDTSRESLKLRYSLLRYMYTIMVMKKGKGSFFRPLSFQFPTDQRVFEDETIQTQFMIGRGLMVAPVVYAGLSERKVYFPGQGQTWHSFKIQSKLGKAILNSIQDYIGSSAEVVKNPLPSAAPTFLRSGHAILTNVPTNRAKLLDNRYNLLASLSNGHSKTQILAIIDYDNEAQISRCIGQGCLTEIELKRIDGSKFSLGWKYSGLKELVSELWVDSVVVLEGGSKWMYETAIRVEGLEGLHEFQMTAL